MGSEDVRDVFLMRRAESALRREARPAMVAEFAAISIRSAFDSAGVSS